MNGARDWKKDPKGRMIDARQGTAPILMNRLPFALRQYCTRRASIIIASVVTPALLRAFPFFFHRAKASSPPANAVAASLDAGRASLSLRAELICCSCSRGTQPALCLQLQRHRTNCIASFGWPTFFPPPPSLVIERRHRIASHRVSISRGLDWFPAPEKRAGYE